MYMEPSKTAIPIRKARSILRELTERPDPVLLLNFNTPCAILIPIPHAGWLKPRPRAKVRARLRTQFAWLLTQALPKGR